MIHVLNNFLRFALFFEPFTSGGVSSLAFVCGGEAGCCCESDTELPDPPRGGGFCPSGGEFFIFVKAGLALLADLPSAVNFCSGFFFSFPFINS